MEKKNFLGVLYIGTERITKTIQAESYEKACDKFNVIAKEQGATIEDIMEM